MGSGREIKFDIPAELLALIADMEAQCADHSGLSVSRGKDGSISIGMDTDSQYDTLVFRAEKCRQ